MRSIQQLFFLILLSCAGRSERILSTGELITSPGTYQYDSVPDLVIAVYLENNLVRYKVQNAIGVEVVKSVDKIGNFQRWAFYVDKRGDFWAFSNDIGNVVWHKDDSLSTYKATGLSEISEVPKEIKEKVERYF